MAGVRGLLAGRGWLVGTVGAVLVAFGTAFWVFDLLVDAHVPSALAIAFGGAAGTVVSMSLTVVACSVFPRRESHG